MHDTKRITFLFLIITLLLLCIFTIQLLNKQTDAGFSCGVKDSPIAEQAIEEEKNPIPGYEEGERLFKENCKSCHKLHEESVGPALYCVTNRRPKKWLYAFIQNSTKLIQKKDTMAVNLYTRYGKAQMTSFPTLTKTEIDALLIYIEAGPLPRVVYLP